VKQMKRIKGCVARLLIAAMVITMVPVFSIQAAGSTNFVDMPSDWSTDALQKAVSNGLISGFDEPGGKYIKPTSSLTRAQMATMVNRAFGAENLANLSQASDISSTEWYAREMAKAVAMGTFKIDATMRPNAPITRQEAFTVLARAFKLTDQNNGYSLYKFVDGNSVADYAKSAVSAMIDAKYLAGSNGYLYPSSNISRAEFAKVMDNLLKYYCSNSGQVFSVSGITGNLMVNESNVTIKNTTIRGDLIIGDGVGSGTVTLDNVDVTGRTIVRGGGLNSIVIKSNCDIPSVTIVKVDGNVRVYVESGGTVDLVNIDDGDDDVVLKGTFGRVNVNVSLPVTFNGADVEYVYVYKTSTMTVDKDSEIDKITVDKGATSCKLVNSGLVTKLISDIKVTVSGTGTVTENLATGGTGVIESVAAITGTPTVGNVLKVGAVKPSGATVSYQWKRATSATGTYSNISGATSSTYTLVGDDLDKYIKVMVTGKNTYTGTATSTATTKVLVSKITATTIGGVTVPVLGATPVTTVTSTSEYTGTVTWSPAATTFAAGTAYTATITLTPKTGYTVTGITANQFTISGATTDTNPANSGVITAAFPATGLGLASGLTPLIGALSTPGNEQIQLTVSTAPQTTGHKIYYRVVSTEPSARTLGSVVTLDATWIEVTVQTGITVSGVADNRFIEVIEVLASTNGVTKWGKAGPTSDGWPVLVPASGLTVTIASKSTPVESKVDITQITEATSGYAIYYRVTNNPTAPYAGTAINLSGWTQILGTTLSDLTVQDGYYVEAVEVKTDTVLVSKWGKSAASDDGYTPPPVAPTVSSAATSDATTIILTMSSSLTNTLADATAFTINGATSVPLVSGVSVSGTSVTLTLNGAIATGESITVNYTATGTNDLTNGTPVASFTGQSVTNNI